MLLEARTAWLTLVYKGDFSGSNHWKVGFKHSKSQGSKDSVSVPPPTPIQLCFPLLAPFLFGSFPCGIDMTDGQHLQAFIPFSQSFHSLEWNLMGSAWLSCPLRPWRIGSGRAVVLWLAGLGSHARPWSCCQWLHWAEGGSDRRGSSLREIEGQVCQIDQDNTCPP